MSKQKLIGKTGIYAILINDVIRYIGSSVNLESRKSNHLARLRKGTHHKELQKLFDKYGEESFKFYVLDYCNKSSCYELEKLHMMIHADTIVNENKVRDTKKKVRRGLESKNHKDKFSKLMSGENNPNAKISEKIASEILWMKQNTDMKQIEIVEKYGVTIGIVSRIGRDRWVGVEPIKPDWFEKDVG
ncbi:GIY-YIG nuclease family protein [Proteiniborus sp. MB09-C3]|uniref:GIY-YIG nuclease family protein n=1 Tax=Proteiniborus sp. MB09-C3 TaxID=3050072 RepID=UPI0025530154|nr:GIY-YIG nuclease family protein [Proteiniborus sp. MB09-C3]WIV10530.1 GIY-YIG nuclease family protein [Proteiniborus sp. MB09-C3]